MLQIEVDAWEVAPLFTNLLKSTSIQFIKDRVKLLHPSDHLNQSTADHGSTLSRGTVHLESGVVIEYDWLVLALGAESKLDVVPGSAKYALPFSTLADAHVASGDIGSGIGNYVGSDSNVNSVRNYIDGDSNVAAQPKVKNMSHGDISVNAKCKLFHWSVDGVVAEDRIASTYPKAKVHHVHLVQHVGKFGLIKFSWRMWT